MVACAEDEKRRPLASLPPLTPPPSVAHKFPKIPVTPSSLGLNPNVSGRACADIRGSAFGVKSNRYRSAQGREISMTKTQSSGVSYPPVRLAVKGWGLSDWPVSAVRGPPGKKRDSTS